VAETIKTENNKQRHAFPPFCLPLLASTMPAVRLSRRPFSPARSGISVVNSPSPRPFTFAPNVTPGTFVEPDSLSPTSSNDNPASPSSTLFPPSDLPAPAPSRRRVPPGKRRSLGYIPRPPNAFMLFRADFVRQKHVPGSIETNHGSLSKIIGNCWKSLPLEEKRVWEVKAKHAKAEHKARYPEYRFRPVHNKNKDRKKDKPTPSLADERRCEEVAQLLLEGKKGDELAAAVRSLDSKRDDVDGGVPPLPQHPIYGHRRSSSVPLPNYHPGIALPALSFLTHSRPTSPVGNISRGTRQALGTRRASSARPALTRSWTGPTGFHPLQHDNSPLPAVDTSLFEPSFLDSGAGFSFSAHDSPPFNFHDVLASLSPLAPGAPCPLDPLSTAPGSVFPPYAAHMQTPSLSSSASSGSPAHSEHGLPHLVAPQPLPATHMQPRLSALWKDFAALEQHGASMGMYDGVGAPAGYDGVFAHDMGFDMGVGMGQYQSGLENLFEHHGNDGCGNMHDPAMMAFGFEFNDMVHE
jgi:hypothetical protein